MQLRRAAYERRPRIVSCGFEHRGQQRVLVLAIAVLVFENRFGRVRLVASDSEGYADIPHLRGDVIVDSLDLFVISGLVLDELLNFRLDLRAYARAVTGQASEPRAHLLPVAVCGPG